MQIKADLIDGHVSDCVKEMILAMDRMEQNKEYSDSELRNELILNMHKAVAVWNKDQELFGFSGVGDLISGLMDLNAFAFANKSITAIQKLSEATGNRPIAQDEAPVGDWLFEDMVTLSRLIRSDNLTSEVDAFSAYITRSFCEEFLAKEIPDCKAKCTSCKRGETSNPDSFHLELSGSNAWMAAKYIFEGGFLVKPHFVKLSENHYIVL